eukprot:maker-scaffold876_size86062-snap-gene-0.22 protein:Tk10527 transcript:maker-scaffold876_size86062-snap-gene-0.22-mRNA-1 annotation:"hypothetical protein"
MNSILVICLACLGLQMFQINSASANGISPDEFEEARRRLYTGQDFGGNQSQPRECSGHRGPPRKGPKHFQADVARHWPNAIVPYVIDTTITDT